MKKDNNVGLYVGLLLVLGGIVAFLDLNNLLPGGFFSEYLNLILGIIVLVAYLKTKKLPILMVSSFFVFNGILLIIDKLMYGWNYLSGIFIIPGLMCIVAFIVKRYLRFLIPGALLTSWGIYILLITAQVISGFTMTLGMGFIFTALAFFIIFLYDQEVWCGIPSLVFTIVGIIIVTLGLGEIARIILFNITAVLVIIVGLILIVRSFIRPKTTDERDE